MTIAIKPYLKSKTFCRSKSHIHFKEQEINLVKSKSYQKFFLVLIAMSIILIFPESPRELENICKFYNSRELCNVW